MLVVHLATKILRIIEKSVHVNLQKSADVMESEQKRSSSAHRGRQRRWEAPPHRGRRHGVVEVRRKWQCTLCFCLHRCGCGSRLGLPGPRSARAQVVALTDEQDPAPAHCSRSSMWPCTRELVSTVLGGPPVAPAGRLVAISRAFGLRLYRGAPDRMRALDGLPMDPPPDGDGTDDWDVPAILVSNAMRFPKRRSGVFALEVKPKWGYIPRHRAVKPSARTCVTAGICQHCLLQPIKLRRGKVKDLVNTAQLTCTPLTRRAWSEPSRACYRPHKTTYNTHTGRQRTDIAVQG